MRHAVLYTLNKKNVLMSRDGYIDLLKWPDDRFYRISGSPDAIISAERISLPVQRYCWSEGKEVLAAFDEEVLELIGLSREQTNRNIQTAAKRKLDEYKKEIQSLTLWQKIKWVFFQQGG